MNNRLESSKLFVHLYYMYVHTTYMHTAYAPDSIYILHTFGTCILHFLYMYINLYIFIFFKIYNTFMYVCMYIFIYIINIYLIKYI